MKKGKIFVVSAPSGAGKSTICNQVLKEMDNIVFSVSMTTRQPRTGEIDGVHYKFVSEDYFKKLIEKNEFLEWAKVHNNYYGTPISLINEQIEKGNDVILDIDVQGGMQVKERIPESILIFVAPPSLEELEKRLRGRATDAEDVILVRLNNAKNEMEYMDKYEHQVVNDNLENAIKSFKNVILSYRK